MPNLEMQDEPTPDLNMPSTIIVESLARIQCWFRLCAIALALPIIFPTTDARAAEKIWPTADWRTSTPEEQGMRSEVLADMLERIRRNGYRIDSVLIVRNGNLVLDAYFHPRWIDQRHAIHSVTKSVMSALIGIAIDKGYIAGVDVPVLEFFPDRQIENVDARKRQMTIEHLLTMTTGLKCRDSHRHGYVGYLKMQQSADWTKFVLDLPMEAVPGQRFEYCNGASFLLAAILEKATKTDALEFAAAHLFAALGVEDVSWSRSARNIRNGCCGLSLKPPDMAKFGWLFLNKGEWNRHQVIPAAWIDLSTRPHVKISDLEYYGYQWWGDPSGYYMAIGYKGQLIFVIPGKNMVVVFTGSLERSPVNVPKMLLDKFIIPAATSDVPLPPNRG